MTFTLPSFAQIRADYLRDLKNLDATAHTDIDSDNFIRASAVASAADGIYQHQNWIARQILPDTADPENLERHAALRGLSRKPGTRAAGTLTFTRAGDVPPFPIGLTAMHPVTLETFVTVGAFTGGEGDIIIPCVATRIGTMPEYHGEPVLLQNAPFGVLGQCTLELTGGTEQETHAELLSRLLFYMQNPPGGGMASDYERWAMEVPGVAFAKCHPLRRGLGTVDIVILGVDGPPSPEVLATTQQHLDMKRPVACPDCRAFAPVSQFIAIHAKVRLVAGLTLPMLYPKVQAALDRYFHGLLPGDICVISRITSVILDVSGILDVEIVSPSSNTLQEALRWPRCGNLLLEPL